METTHFTSLSLRVVKQLERAERTAVRMALSDLGDVKYLRRDRLDDPGRAGRRFTFTIEKYICKEIDPDGETELTAQGLLHDRIPDALICDVSAPDKSPHIMIEFLTAPRVVDLRNVDIVVNYSTGASDRRDWAASKDDPAALQQIVHGLSQSCPPGTKARVTLVLRFSFKNARRNETITLWLDPDKDIPQVFDILAARGIR